MPERRFTTPALAGFAAGFLVASLLAVLVIRQGRHPAGSGPLTPGSAIAVTYPTGERLPKSGGGTVAAPRTVRLVIYRTGDQPGGQPQDGRDVWAFQIGEVNYFAAAP